MVVAFWWGGSDFAPPFRNLKIAGERPLHWGTHCTCGPPLTVIALYFTFVKGGPTCTCTILLGALFVPCPIPTLQLELHLLLLVPRPQELVSLGFTALPTRDKIESTLFCISFVNHFCNSGSGSYSTLFQSTPSALANFVLASVYVLMSISYADSAF